MVASFKFNEEKEELLQRVRATADFERHEAPAKPENTCVAPMYLEAKAKEEAKRAFNERATAEIAFEVNRETRGFASSSGGTHLFSQTNIPL